MSIKTFFINYIYGNVISSYKDCKIKSGKYPNYKEKIIIKNCTKYKERYIFAAL